MIKIDGKEYRNLEEQVQANKNNIERIIEGEELLARLGIKVVGQVEAESELPNPVTYEGEFGDAFLVGLETPYDYYIFTRPFEGETDPQWFNLGPFPVAGPQGPQGPQGPKGADGVRGSQWFSGTGQPTTTSGFNIGDYYINVGTGNIWHLHDVDGVAKWLLEGNIIGPQGPQGIQGERGARGAVGPVGPQGPAGPAGPVVDIIGELANIDQLPDPDSVARNAAYLIPVSGVKHVYIIIENEGTGELSWYDGGIFSGGTIVKVNGSPVNEFNADTKLNTGASMEYLNDTLTVYQMSGGSRTVNRTTLRGDVFDVRNGTNATGTYGATAATMNNYSAGGKATRYTVGQILQKASSSAGWQTLNLPTAGGTLARTVDITNAVNTINRTIANVENRTTISSISSYSSSARTIIPEAGKSYIFLLRANASGQKWTFTASGPESTSVSIESQLMLVFWPSEPWRATQAGEVYRPWIIQIDQGSLIPNVAAHTYDVYADEAVFEHLSNTGNDVCIFTQG